MYIKWQSIVMREKLKWLMLPSYIIAENPRGLYSCFNTPVCAAAAKWGVIFQSCYYIYLFAHPIKYKVDKQYHKCINQYNIKTIIINFVVTHELLNIQGI